MKRSRDVLPTPDIGVGGIRRRGRGQDHPPFRGMVLTTRDVAFAKTQSGFVEFHEHVQALQVAHAMFDVLAGMESTDHYWFNLAH